MERETGIEPATNSLEGCDSTTELLPPTRSLTSPVSCFGGQARATAASLAVPPFRRKCPLAPRALLLPARLTWLASRSSLAIVRAKDGGEGRTRTFEAARATDLQSAAFDRFATSPMRCLDLCSARPS